MGTVGEDGTLASRLAPALFVLLWSTGFIGARLGLPHAEPFTFLALRMAITLVLLAPLAIGLTWPGWPALAHAAAVGVLVHAGYLGAVFWAISRGLPAGVASLIVALQPILTAIVAFLLLAERLTRRQLVGLAGGLAGVALVVGPKLGGQATSYATPTIVACLFAVLCMSVGAVYQKRFVSRLDLRLSTFAQYVGALVPLWALSALLETRRIEWTGEFIFALGWLVLVLSLGAVGLLMWLIRRNSAAGTAALFYLVPAATALTAWAMFGETLTPVQLAGMALAMASVALATAGGRSRPAGDRAP